MDVSIFTAKYLKKTNPLIFKIIAQAQDIEELRSQLIDFTFSVEQQAVEEASSDDASLLARIRDCGFSFRTILKKGSEQAADFSILQVLWDIGHDIPRPELSPAFFADLLYMVLGMQGQGLRKAPDAIHLTAVESSGRKAAVKRSRQLDNLWTEVDRRMSAYPSGLEEQAVLRRQARREKILSVLGGSLED